MGFLTEAATRDRSHLPGELLWPLKCASLPALALSLGNPRLKRPESTLRRERSLPKGALWEFGVSAGAGEVRRCPWLGGQFQRPQLFPAHPSCPLPHPHPALFTPCPH